MKRQKERERKEREEEKKRKAQKEAERLAERAKVKRIEAIPASSDAGVMRKLEAGAGLFLAPYAFDNTLPPVPVDPKLLSLTFNKDKFVRFRYDSSAEAGHSYELLAEPDLGITIDLVDPQAYEKVPGATLAREDAELLSASALGKAVGEAQASSSTVKQMRQEVTWLRKTPLMGNNLYDAIHKHKKEQVETKHVVKESRALALEKEQGIGGRSLAQQIEAIEKTFADAAELSTATLTHPTNPALTCVSLLPVLPDFNCWSNTYVQMQFDCDPALESVTDTEPKFGAERVAQSVVKGFSQAATAHAPAQPYLSYLLPEERKEEGEEGDAPAEGDSYFLVLGADDVVYNEFASKIAATRKAFRRIDARPTAVTLARREADDDEQDQQSARRQRLMLGGPLLISTDLRKISDDALRILKATELIAINQDELATQGVRVGQPNATGPEVWAKRLCGGRYGVVLLNRGDVAADIALDLAVAFPERTQWSLRDLWAESNLGSFRGTFTAPEVPPHGNVALLASPA